MHQRRNSEHQQLIDELRAESSPKNFSKSQPPIAASSSSASSSAAARMSPRAAGLTVNTSLSRQEEPRMAGRAESPRALGREPDPKSPGHSRQRSGDISTMAKGSFGAGVGSSMRSQSPPARSSSSLRSQSPPARPSSSMRSPSPPARPPSSSQTSCCKTSSPLARRSCSLSFKMCSLGLASYCLISTVVTTSSGRDLINSWFKCYNPCQIGIATLFRLSRNFHLFGIVLYRKKKIVTLTSTF